MSELEQAIAPLSINETKPEEKEASIPQSKKEKSSPKKEVASPKKEATPYKARCIVQQCTKATLQTKLADPEADTESESVQIDRGVVLFICFMRDAEESDVEKIVKSVLEIKLSEQLENPSKLTSVLDLPGDVLIIPQACLGGKMKGKNFQYHYNINKTKGQELYDKFVTSCQAKANQNANWKKGCKLFSGTYGIKQIYSTETNGPFMHIVEF